MKRSVFLTTPLLEPLFMAMAPFFLFCLPPNTCFPGYSQCYGLLLRQLFECDGASSPDTSLTTVWEKNIGDDYLFGG